MKTLNPTKFQEFKYKHRNKPELFIKFGYIGLMLLMSIFCRNFDTSFLIWSILLTTLYLKK